MAQLTIAILVAHESSGVFSIQVNILAGHPDPNDNVSEGHVLLLYHNKTKLIVGND